MSTTRRIVYMSPHIRDQNCCLAAFKSYFDARVSAAVESILLDWLACSEYLRTAERNGRLAAVGSILPFKMSANGTNFPYKRCVSSLSWVSAAPFKSTPANKPRARE